MPTITSQTLVKEIIDGNGVYETDPPVQSIVEYTSSFGGTCCGLNYSKYDAYYETEFVRNPKTIFTRKND